MKRLWIDANVLLRFLTGDPKDLADKAARLMARAEKGEVVLVVFPLVLAEVVWVLKSFYRHSHEDIAGVLVPLMSADGNEIEDRETWIQAIELARDKNIDFVDAALALQAARRGETVCSFDGDFKRLPAEWMRPPPSAPRHAPAAAPGPAPPAERAPRGRRSPRPVHVWKGWGRDDRRTTATTATATATAPPPRTRSSRGMRWTPTATASSTISTARTRTGRSVIPTATA